jgi:hypothetical protein
MPYIGTQLRVFAADKRTAADWRLSPQDSAAPGSTSIWTSLGKAELQWLIKAAFTFGNHLEIRVIRWSIRIIIKKGSGILRCMTEIMRLNK